jgi:hypothetical protein
MRRFVTPFGIALALAACSGQPEAQGPEAAEADGGMVEGGMADGGMAMGDGQAMMDMGPSEAAMKKKREAADMLVARFDSETCRKVDMLGRVRKTEPDGSKTVLHAFAAPNACADSIQAAVANLGFAETEPGIFALGADDGSAERVFVQFEEDGSGAVVEWEVSGK